MTTPGLSLLGFLDEPAAINYLRNSCVFADNSDSALRGHWKVARDMLGEAGTRPGKPEIKDLPNKASPYLDGVQKNPRFPDTIQGAKSWAFKLVEVDPLLAFQYHVETDRSEQLCSAASTPPKLSDLLTICLPHALEEPPVQFAEEPNGFWIRTRSSNMRVFGHGRMGPSENQVMIGGVLYGIGSPLVQVVQFEDRCYLKNGYHRAYALRCAGCVHVPCVFLEAGDYEIVGAGAGFFGRELLESNNPPTCGHFTSGKAYGVTLKSLTREIHVSWSEQLFPDAD